MTKNKLKLSLIDDYVKLVIFENFFNTYNNLSFKEAISKRRQNTRLKKLYDILFEKLSMNDCSLLLLRQQLNKNNQLEMLCNQQTEKDTLKKIFNSINNIEKMLPEKLARLKINSLELLKHTSI